MDKKQLSDFFKTAPKQDIINYLEKFLLERKREKQLVYSLGQVELRSLNLPGINYLNNLLGDYYQWAESLEFKNRLEKFKEWDTAKILNKRNIIYCDTREQIKLSFSNVKVVDKCLSYGDYAFSNSEWAGRVVIERKSGADFIGTMVGGYKRFVKEVERAKNDDSYLIVLVENTLSDLLDYHFKRIVSSKIRFPVAVIFHSVRELMQNYNNIQFLFVDSHESAGQMVEKLFSLGGDIKRYDLQYLLDLKKI